MKIEPHKLRFNKALGQEVDAIGQMFDAGFDAQKPHSRIIWLAIAYIALGKADCIKAGRFNMGEPGETKLNTKWVVDLYAISSEILTKFQPGDGKF